MRQFVAAAMLTLAAAGLAAQTQNRDTPADRPRPSATGVIAGTVVSFETGRPVRFATVTLAGPNEHRETTTDDAGGFSFEGIGAGTYSLSVAKSGLLDAIYGQTRPGSGSSGTPIRLADGQRIDRLRLPISRGGAIGGIVRDDRGDPVFQVQVEVMRWVMRDGTATLDNVGGGVSDERGVYRVPLLPPGRYVVHATPAEDAIPETKGKPQGTMGFAAMFHPASATIASALVIPIGLGDDRSDVDITLPVLPRTRIAGVVISADGKPAPNMPVSLVDHGVPGADVLVSSATTDADGRFEFPGVVPGAYTVTAGVGESVQISGKVFFEHKKGGGAEYSLRLEKMVDVMLVNADIVSATGPDGAPLTPPPANWAEQEVVVNGAAVPDLTLSLQPGRTVAGRLTFSGNTPPRTPESPLTIELERISGRFETAHASAKVAADGTFTMKDVIPGRYRMTVDGPVPHPWTIASAIAGGREALDSWLEVPSDRDVRDLAITFRDRAQELSGKLLDNSPNPVFIGFTIVVFPVDEALWTAGNRRIRTASPTSDGNYVFEGLPPGTYRLALVSDIEPDQWFDPAFLRQLAAASATVTLGEGEKKTQDLRIR